jgi:hypothetical protein
VEAREIRARMELPMVRAVLETGVDRNSVMKVIERRLRETGNNWNSQNNSNSSNVFTRIFYLFMIPVKVRVRIGPWYLVA